MEGGGGRGGSQKNTNKKPLLCSFSNVDVFNLGLPPHPGVSLCPPPPLYFLPIKGHFSRVGWFVGGGGR